MHVVIAGGSGFLGSHLTRALTGRGDRITVLTRRPETASQAGPDGLRRTAVWRADGLAEPSLIALVGDADAVINLAGAGLADKRWTSARKQQLRESRLLPTRSLVAAVMAATTRPRAFIQGSAIGYYGASVGDRVFTEADPAGDDFLGRLSRDWEAEARPVADLGCRLVLMRTSVVLGADGGAVPPLKMPFLFFAGGPIASGRQYMTWIHIDDWVALVLWALDNEAVDGAINASAPNPVPNRTFAAALGRVLGRPSWLPAPAFALRLLVGEFADEGLIKGQRVVPARAQALGFRFQYEDVTVALRDVIGR